MKFLRLDRLLFYGFVVLASGCGGGSSNQVPMRSYQVTDLGRVSGPILHLNNLGEIAAYSISPTPSTSHAGLYRNGQWYDLGTLGGVYSVAIGINHLGEVIGFSEVPDVPDNVIFHAFVWQDAQMIDLGVFGAGSDFRAVGINNAGQIVGNSGDAGWLWENGAFTALPMMPSAINNKSQVLGQINHNGQLGPIVVWQNGQLTTVGPYFAVTGYGGTGATMNDNGQIVGTYMPSLAVRDGFRFNHAFLWQEGKLHDLGTLGGTGSAAWSINNSGEIVGNADTGTVIQTGIGPDHLVHAFLYSNGKMLDLNSLIPTGSTWELSQATSINDKGQIVGYGQMNGQDHSFLLTPQ